MLNDGYETHLKAAAEGTLALNAFARRWDLTVDEAREEIEAYSLNLRRTESATSSIEGS
jgi:predicted phage tail protein